MNENDIPPPTDLKIGCAQVNALVTIEGLLETVIDLLKQIAANTTPKKAP